MNYELELINSILETKDINEVRNISNVFYQYEHIWNFIDDYYNKYETLPTKSIVNDKFEDFDMLNVSEAPLSYYIDKAVEESLAISLRNTLKQSVDVLKENGPKAAMTFTSSQLFDLMKSTGQVTDTNIALDYMDRVSDLRQRKSENKTVLGIPTGIVPLDEIFGGWQPGDFVCLLGFTSMGKSWIGLLFAVNAWLNGYSPLIINLEMNKYQIGYRIDTILNGGIDFTNSDLTHARHIDPDHYERWAKTTFDGRPPFHVVTSDGIGSPTQNMVEAKIDQYKPDFVLLDYHLLFEDGKRGGNETERAKNLSKDFKQIALRTQTPIVDIASVTMSDGHHDRPPMLEEVAWSKQLAYDSDLVLATHRDPYTNNFQIVSRKTRRCPEFAFYLEWDLDKGQWRERYTENETGENEGSLRSEW